MNGAPFRLRARAAQPCATENDHSDPRYLLVLKICLFTYPSTTGIFL